MFLNKEIKCASKLTVLLEAGDTDDDDEGVKDDDDDLLSGLVLIIKRVN